MISRTKPRQPKGLLILITVLSSIIIIDACRKIDYCRHDDKRPDNPVTAANKFFKMSPNTPSYVKKIAEAIRHQNDKKEFVTKFLREIGVNVVINFGVSKYKTEKDLKLGHVWLTFNGMPVFSEEPLIESYRLCYIFPEETKIEK